MDVTCWLCMSSDFTEKCKVSEIQKFKKTKFHSKLWRKFKKIQAKTYSAIQINKKAGERVKV